jgi:hypothetical protein
MKKKGKWKKRWGRKWKKDKQTAKRGNTGNFCLKGRKRGKERDK